MCEGGISKDPKNLKNDVLYEMKMLFSTAYYFYDIKSSSIQKRAFLESFLIHLRNLIYFFMDTPSKNKYKIDDAHAIDYLKNDVKEHEFNNGIANYSDWKSIKEYIDWKIAHITYKRKKPKIKKVAWQVHNLIKKMNPFIDEFLEKIDRKLIDDKSINELIEIIDFYNCNVYQDFISKILFLVKTEYGYSTASQNITIAEISKHKSNN